MLMKHWLADCLKQRSVLPVGEGSQKKLLNDFTRLVLQGSHQLQQFLVEAADIMLPDQSALGKHMIAVTGREDIPDAGTDHFLIRRYLLSLDFSSGSRKIYSELSRRFAQ